MCRQRVFFCIPFRKRRRCCCNQRRRSRIAKKYRKKVGITQQRLHLQKLGSLGSQGGENLKSPVTNFSLSLSPLTVSFPAKGRRGKNCNYVVLVVAAHWSEIECGWWADTGKQSEKERFSVRKSKISLKFPPASINEMKNVRILYWPQILSQ